LEDVKRQIVNKPGVVKGALGKIGVTKDWAESGTTKHHGKEGLGGPWAKTKEEGESCLAKMGVWTVPRTKDRTKRNSN